MSMVWALVSAWREEGKESVSEWETTSGVGAGSAKRQLRSQGIPSGQFLASYASDVAPRRSSASWW